MERFTCIAGCHSYYNLEDRVPLLLKCGHSICKNCAGKVFNLYREILCYCNRVQNTKSIDDLPKDEGIISEMKEEFLECERHKAFMFSLNRDLMVLQCEDCNIDLTHQTVLATKEFVKISFEKAIRQLFNSTNFSIVPESLVEFKKEFQEVLANQDAKKIYDLFLEIRSYLTDKFICSIHGEQDPCYTSKAIVNCSKCFSNIFEHDMSAMCNKLLNDVYQQFFGGSLRAFFYLETQEILAMPIKLRRESYQQMISQPKWPSFKNKCLNCLNYFSIGHKRPIALPCEAHFVCYSCYTTQEKHIRCRIHGQFYDKTHPEPVNIRYLFDSPLRCVKNEYLCKKSLFFLPCKHLICERCYEIGRETSLVCDACEIEYTIDTKVDRIFALEELDQYLDVKCKIHKTERAISFNKKTLEGKCEACIRSNRESKNQSRMNENTKELPVSIDNLRQIERFFHKRFSKDRYRKKYSNELIRELDYKKPIMPLNSKLLVLKKMKKRSDSSPLNSRIVELERFFRIIPNDKQHIEFAWKTEDSEKIVLSYSGTSPLCGIIIGGDIYGNPIDGNIEIEDYSHQIIYSDQIRIEQIKSRIFFERDIQVQDRICITVEYFGDNLVYNGSNRYRFENLSHLGNSVEVHIDREKTRRRNDIGGPILGFIFKEYLF